MVVEVIPRTRLQPMFRPSRWGDWEALLSDGLPDRSRVEQAVRDEGVVLVFELWGNRNPHLVRYETPLALTLHTAIQGSHPLPHTRLRALAERYALDVVPTLEVVEPAVEAIADGYRRWQGTLEARNQAADDAVAEEGRAPCSLPSSRRSCLSASHPPSRRSIGKRTSI